MIRHRRSEQKKQQKLKKRLLYAFIGVTAFAALLFAGGYIWLISYITGDDFRQASERKLEKTLANGSRVSIPKPFLLDGFNLGLPEGSVSVANGIGKMSLLHAQSSIDLGALKDKCLSFPKVTVNRLDLKITNPTNRKADSPVIPLLPQSPVTSKPSNTRPAKTGKPSSSELRVLVGSVIIENGNLAYDGYNIKNTQISLKPLEENFSSWSLSLKNGTLKTPYPLLRDMPLKTLNLTSRKGDYTLQKLRLSCPPGEIGIQGTYSSKKRNWAIHGRIDKLPAEQLFPQILHDCISGFLFGKIHCKGDTKWVSAINGDVVLQDGTLKSLPFLGKLGFNFQNIRLDKASASFSYPYNDNEKNIKNAKLIDRIELESVGKIRLKGRIIIGEDEKLSGTLTVGIDSASFNRFPKAAFAAVDTIFNARGESGYRWVNVNLSGTLSDPQEDLTARLLNLLGSGVFHTIENTADGIFKALTPEDEGNGASPNQEQDPSTLMDKATDTASGLLQKGLQSLF